MMKEHHTCLDMTGRNITLPATPQRIISLVPSQTELLYDLGLGERVAGITTFCVRPASWYKSKTRVGGTKKVHLEKIRGLQPDLIIANKEENIREQVEALRTTAPVWTSDVGTLEDAYRMMAGIGWITGREKEAQALIESIRKEFTQLPVAGISKRPRVLYLIWRNPWMTVGHDTFIHDMLSRIGLENVIVDTPRYPELSHEQIEFLQPDLVFLSSEPYPFKEMHIKELQNILPSAKTMLVDGQMFSWYGSRLKEAAEYFVALLHRLSR